MKLVTQTEASVDMLQSESKAIRMLCEAGYDGLDYSMFRLKNDDCILNKPGYKDSVMNIKSIADSYGVTFEQSHAPFASAIDGNERYNKDMLEKLKRSIEIAGLLDAKIIVVHPVFYKKDKFQKNMELYHALEPYAERYGVKIALENMWGRGGFFKGKRIIPNVCSVTEEFNQYVDALNPEHFTACLDLGHCGLVGENAADMIRGMNSRLGCLHIHDNNNISDDHTLPYLKDMNWDEILKALADIDYKGNFTYEADNFLKPFPVDLLPDVVKFMVAVGRNMIKQIDNYKGENK